MLNPRIEYRGLTAVAANAAASARTLTIDTRQVDKLGICLTLTRIAATALTLILVPGPRGRGTSQGRTMAQFPAGQSLSPMAHGRKP